jgi:septal ring factor EnvC (AmiA/AmiB activator)
MPENDNAGATGDAQDDTAATGGSAATADEERAAQDLLTGANQDNDSDDDSDTTLGAKGKVLLARYRAEQAALRKQLKELQPAAKRLRELEDKDKSESQKLAEQVASLERQIAGFEVREVRAAAAAAAGLPAHMAKFISADDPEEAKQQAKSLAAWGKTGAAAPDLHQGARPAPPHKVTEDEFIRNLAGRNR